LAREAAGGGLSPGLRQELEDHPELLAALEGAAQPVPSICASPTRRPGPSVPPWPSCSLRAAPGGSAGSRCWRPIRWPSASGVNASPR
jgi:hypothetical protein